ncbi:MAG: extracellular solute-binding protein [Parvibaculales bacterium]
MYHFKIFFISLFLVFTSGLAQADAPTQKHALSLFGQPKYPASFTHFDYVRPDAPKGGTVKLAAFGRYDSFNPYIIKGSVADQLNLIYDTLTKSSLDEPNSQYGLVAQSISYADDFSHVQFRLNPKARFHDGHPIDADDVVWTFQTLMANHPFYAAYYGDVEKVTSQTPDEVTFHFRVTGNRELPQIVGQLPVLPKHYWTSNGRDMSKTTLEPPLGSGPYKIEKFEAGRQVTFARVPDYWARDLNVNKGHYNFDQIRFDYFGDLTVAFEAFKAGNLDFQLENNSKRWATGYDIPAVKNGEMIQITPLNGNTQGMQGFVLNQRRELFQDIRVREALTYAFDFEWANKTLFYGQYKRTDSYFDNTELAAQGLPSAAELALLNPLKEQIPAQVFTTPYQNPVNLKTSDMRQNLRHAKKRLAEAGWQVQNGKLMRDGQVFKVEFLLVQAAFERIVAPYIQNLRKLGIEASIRLIDVTQYQNRLLDYDFDIIVSSFGQSLSPGNEQRNYWGSDSATRQGGRNYIGIQNPAIDALIEEIIFAKDREAQITATRALDRVLLWNFYVVPHWHIANHRLAYWRPLAHPKPLPPYAHGFPDIWWSEQENSEQTR